MADLPDGTIPRVDELFSRAVVAQLAEQRAQRETFAEVERKLEGLERMVSERLSDLSKLLRNGEVEMRLEVLEEEIGSRLTRIEGTVKTDLGRRVETLEQTLGERLDRMEEAIRADDVARRLSGLELSVAQRIDRLEESVTALDIAAGMAALDRALSERLGRVEAMVSRVEAVGPRLDTLETSLSERLGHLEETVRSEEIGRRLKALEMAVEERSSRLEEFVKTGDVERRLEVLQQAVDERLESVHRALDASARESRLEALDQAVGNRLSGLEGSLRRLEEQTGARLEDLRQASMAAEAGILERIVAESQTVAAHFEAVRPLVEAGVRPDAEFGEALAELRRLAEEALEATARATAAAEAARPGGDENSPGPGETKSYREARLDDATTHEGEDSVFLPPEETPIPDRRFGGLLPRRER